MAESITNKKIISFAGKNIDLDEFIRRALARAVEWMDYQGLKGDERVDFLNSFNTRLLNIVSGQSGNSEQSGTTVAVGVNDTESDGTNYYGKSTGNRKEDGRPRGGIFGTVRRTGFNPELNVDTYLNGIAGTIPSIEELNKSANQTSTQKLKPFNGNTLGYYIQDQIFGEGNERTPELLKKWIDSYDKADESGNRSTEKRVEFIKTHLQNYRDALLRGEYNISEEDRNKEIKRIDDLINLQDYQGWEAGKLAPWLSDLLANPTASTQTLTPAATQEQTLEQTAIEPTEADISPKKARELKDGLTANDWARISSIGLDLVSAGSAFVPGYGTAVSAITGVGSTGVGAVADFTDDDVSAGQAWMGLGTGLLGDVVGLIPGLGEVGKGWKISRAFVKVAPKLIQALRVYGDVQAANLALALYNKLSKEGVSSFNTDDLKSLQAIFSAASLEGRIKGSKYTTKKVLEKAKKMEGQTTISTTKGKKVVDTGTAKKVMEAKTKAEADNALKEAAKTNPDLEGAEAVFGKRKKWLVAGEDVEVNKSTAGNLRRGVFSGNPKEIKEPETWYSRLSSLNPERGNLYDFSNVKQRSGWLGRNFSNEAIVARRVGAVNYPGRPDYKTKLNENPVTTAESSTSGTKPNTTKPKGLNPKTATKAVATVDKTGNTASLERHIKKATGVTLDKSNPNSKVNLRTAIQDLKKAGHTDEQISNMLTNKQFMDALKQQYKFKEGGVIPKFGGGTPENWFVRIFGGPSMAGSGFQPSNSAAVTGRVVGSGGKKVNTRTEVVTSSKKEPSTTSEKHPTITSLASVLPGAKAEEKPKQETKPETKPDKPLEGTVGGNLEGIIGNTGTSETVLTPTTDRPGGNNTPEKEIGNPSDLALTGLELGKFFGSMWANNAILNKYKQLRPYHRINPQQAYRIWSPKPLLDLAQQVKTDADNLGALMARGTNDLGLAAAYRLTSHFKGVDAARPYELQADKEIKDSVNTAISIQNDNQEKRVDRVNDNHKADVAKYNQDRLAEIQRLHDNATKLQQLGSVMQNGIARGAAAKYENDYRTFLATDPEIMRVRNSYRDAKARYDANPDDKKAQQELTNAQNALNNVLTDKSNYWQSSHRESLGYPFGPVIWTSPIPQYQGSFFAKGGNLEVVNKVERGRMKRHYDKLFYNTHKLLVTESNKKQRALGSGFAYFHKLMMQSK